MRITFTGGILAVLLVIGWVMNGHKLVNADFKAPYKEEIVRTIGVIVPLAGGLLGWINIEENKQ